VGARNLMRVASRMQKDLEDIEQAEARDPQAARWTVEEGWLHPDRADVANPADSKPTRPGCPENDDVAS
jgi:hypothetical protein